MTDRPDIVYKTTYSSVEIETKKQTFLKTKMTIVRYLKEITDLIEKSGEEPLSGENRQALMRKFDEVDRSLLNKFDTVSFQYFEAKSAPQNPS